MGKSDDYQILFNHSDGDVKMTLEYFIPMGDGYQVKEFKFVPSPNWVEKLLRITWGMKVDKAERDMEKIARSKIAKRNACVDFLQRYLRPMEGSDG